MDDSAPVRQLLYATLAELVAGLRKASDAAQGLGLWLGRRPQLVFVDFEMPGADGAAFIKILRAQEAVLGWRTAVLMITAHPDGDHVMAAVEAGANGFIVKPLTAVLERAAEALAENPAAGVSYL